MEPLEPNEQRLSTQLATQLSNSQNPKELSHAEVALLAFTISQSQKGRHRSAEENWFEAERILKEQRFQALAGEPSDPKNAKGKSTSGKK